MNKNELEGLGLRASFTVLIIEDENECFGKAHVMGSEELLVESVKTVINESPVYRRILSIALNRMNAEEFRALMNEESKKL